MLFEPIQQDIDRLNQMEREVDEMIVSQATFTMPHHLRQYWDSEEVTECQRIMQRGHESLSLL